MPYYRFPFHVSVINLDNGLSNLIADIPIDEVRPKGFDATRLGINQLVGEEINQANCTGLKLMMEVT